MTGLTARPPWATWLAFTLGGLAFVTVIVYLRPLEEGTWANALMALVVLGAPLATRPPATIQRLLICALVWAGLGMPGAYVFGVPVFYAGCILGVALLARLFLFREREALAPPNSHQKA
jgi:predicted permease